MLAAGAGVRFGGPKQLARIDGRPMLEHVVVQARAVVDRVVVVLGAHAEQVRAEVDLGDAEVVNCPGWEEGIAASLRAGVAALGGVDAAVVLLGDMPYVNAAVLHGALKRLDPEHDAVRTLHRNVPGHPVVLGRRALAAVPGLRGDVGARDLLARLRVCDWEAGHLYDATDVDRPSDLR